MDWSIVPALASIVVHAVAGLLRRVTVSTSRNALTESSVLFFELQIHMGRNRDGR